MFMHTFVVSTVVQNNEGDLMNFNNLWVGKSAGMVRTPYFIKSRLYIGQIFFLNIQSVVVKLKIRFHIYHKAFDKAKLYYVIIVDNLKIKKIT